MHATLLHLFFLIRLITEHDRFTSQNYLFDEAGGYEWNWWSYTDHIT
jgi:hypothetical protein